MTEEDPPASTAEALVYIVVTMYLIAVAVGSIGASIHPFLAALLAMGIVFVFLAYDIPERVESRLKSFLGEFL